MIDTSRVSPAAATLLLEAAGRTSVAEDQLTELLAYALQADDLFRRKFCALCGVDRPRANADVLTQRRLASGRRVDLEIRLHGDGDHAHAVWIEVKVGAPEGQDQLRDYARALHQTWSSRGTLVVLAPRDHEILKVARGPGPFNTELANPIEWQHVIQQLNATGRERCGPAWREHAAKPDAELPQRNLLELYAYCQRQKGLLKVMPDEPLQVADAFVLTRYPDLMNGGGIIESLLERAADRAQLGPTEPWDWRDQRGRTFSDLEPPAWTKDLVAPNGDVSLDLWFWVTDRPYRPDGPRDQAAIFATLFVRPLSEGGRVALQDAVCTTSDPAFPVFTRLEKEDYTVSAVKYLAEVGTYGVTLTDQADALGDWARIALDHLRTLAPPSSAI